jgi:hypothetical protein
MGHAGVEFCRESKPKSFSILFQNETKPPRQSEKMPPVVTFVFLHELQEQSLIFSEHVSRKHE